MSPKPQNAFDRRSSSNWHLCAFREPADSRAQTAKSGQGHVGLKGPGEALQARKGPSGPEGPLGPSQLCVAVGGRSSLVRSISSLRDLFATQPTNALRAQSACSSVDILDHRSELPYSTCRRQATRTHQLGLQHRKAELAHWGHLTSKEKKPCTSQKAPHHSVLSSRRKAPSVVVLLPAALPRTARTQMEGETSQSTSQSNVWAPLAGGAARDLRTGARGHLPQGGHSTLVPTCQWTLNDLQPVCFHGRLHAP